MADIIRERSPRNGPQGVRGTYVNESGKVSCIWVERLRRVCGKSHLGRRGVLSAYKHFRGTYCHNLLGSVSFENGA
jgi:hypothetical protein